MSGEPTPDTREGPGNGERPPNPQSREGPETPGRPESPEPPESPEAREERATDMHVLHGPIMRETARPRDGFQPIPLTLLFVFFALLLWGGWYLGEYDGDYREDVFTPGGEIALASRDQAEPEVDPMVLGRRVYNNCSACHQNDGQGVAGAFPPLAGSVWVTGSVEVLARILLQGMQGPVEVKGAIYNGNMPAWSQLSDEEIAAVLTYIRGSWENEASPVDPETVAKAREATSGREAAWTAEEFEALADTTGK